MTDDLTLTETTDSEGAKKTTGLEFSPTSPQLVLRVNNGGEWKPEATADYENWSGMEPIQFSWSLQQLGESVKILGAAAEVFRVGGGRVLRFGVNPAKKYATDGEFSMYLPQIEGSWYVDLRVILLATAILTFDNPVVVAAPPGRTASPPFPNPSNEVLLHSVPSPGRPQPDRE